MKLTFLLVAALLVSWVPCQSTKLQDHFDLRVNSETVNCVNARKLMNIAEADSSRLQSLSTILNNGLATLITVKKGLDDTCSLVKNAEAGSSFLQTTPISMDSLPALSQKLFNNFVGASLNKELRNKLDSTLTILSEVSDRSTSREDSMMRCEEGTSKLINLSHDLKLAYKSIQKDYLNSFLAERVKEINRVLDTCPISQTGLISKTYLGTGNEFEHRVPRARFQDYKIAFDKPFTEIPSIAVGLNGFDLDTELPAVAALVPEVSETGFTLRVHLVPYARLYSIQVSYLATLPSQSGIYPKLHMIDYQHDKDFAQLAEAVGPRSIERSIALPAEFSHSNVGVVTFLNGFSFGAGADPRLKVAVTKVSPQDFTLRYSTSGSTRFLSAVTYNLIYKTSSQIQNQAGEAAPARDSSFYKGFGPRNEQDSIFLVKGMASRPEIFTGLFAFDFTTGYSYRVNQEPILENENSKETAIKLGFSTVGDTKINMVKSSLFYTCNSRLC